MKPDFIFIKSSNKKIKQRIKTKKMPSVFTKRHFIKLCLTITSLLQSPCRLHCRPDLTNSDEVGLD
jgi:hypothetical protein